MNFHHIRVSDILLREIQNHGDAETGGILQVHIQSGQLLEAGPL